MNRRPLVSSILGAAVALALAPRVAEAVPDRGMDPDAPMSAEDKGIPKHRLFYTNSTFLRYNPLGAINTFSMGWRYRLMESDSVLFEDTYLYLGPSATLSPAFGRVGARAEIAPIALFRAWTTVEGVYYFGTFDQITGFPGPDSVYDDDTLDQLAQGVPTTGWILTTGAVLQAKVKTIAIRSTFQAIRFDLDMEDGETYFYDQVWDRLAPDEQWMGLNDLDVMHVGDKLRLGARWTWSNAFIEESDAVAAMAHNRVGPLFAWQFKDDGPGTRFNKPTFFALAQWWVTHPYRTGEISSQAVPLFAFGLAFQGDLIGPPPSQR